MRGPRCGVSYLIRSGREVSVARRGVQRGRTEFAVVGPLWLGARALGSVRGPRWHEALSPAEVAIASLRVAVAALVLVHVVVHVLWRGGEGVVGLSRTGLQTHVVEARLGPLYLEVAQLGLEVVDVAAAIADLAVQTRQHGGVVGRLPHGVGRVDQGPLPVDLALHIGNGLVDVHVGGGLVGECARRRRRRLRFFADDGQRGAKCLASAGDVGDGGAARVGCGSKHGRRSGWSRRGKEWTAARCLAASSNDGRRRRGRRDGVKSRLVGEL
jgi:hypothetical protein